MDIGALVHILPPFAGAFPDIYTVESTESLEGGIAVHLEGVESAFDPKFLEVVHE